MMSAENFKVRLDRIGDEGFELDERVEQSWLTELLGKRSPFKAAASGRLRVQLLRANEVVHVRGRAELQLQAECSRCLAPVALALDAPIEVALFPRGEEPEPDEHGEVAAEDMGVDTYDAEEVDLSHVLHDEVFLGLPMNPLCSEACAGLCGTCGENLNARACRCEPDIDVRWQALKDIKLH